MIAGALPRYLDFKMEDTIIEMKHKIFNHIKGVFSGTRKPSEEDTDAFEKWINENIILQIKDNTPYVKMSGNYGARKAECEFCGRRHNQRDDICELRTNKEDNGNDLDNGGREITLSNLYDKIEHKRKLRFEVMINKDSGFDFRGFNMNRNFDLDSSDFSKKKSAVSLDACFN